MPFINGNIVAKKVPSGIGFCRSHPTKTATSTTRIGRTRVHINLSTDPSVLNISVCVCVFLLSMNFRISSCLGADLGYQHANDGERIRKKKKRLAQSSDLW